MKHGVHSNCYPAFNWCNVMVKIFTSYFLKLAIENSEFQKCLQLNFKFVKSNDSLG